MKIKEILLSDDIQRIEREIINAHKGIGIRYRDKDYSNFAYLLEIRKDLINKKVLKFQEDLIPEIVEFNETLRNTLQKMYDKAYHIWIDFQKYCCPVKVLQVKKIRLKPSCRIPASFVTLLVAKKL